MFDWLRQAFEKDLFLHIGDHVRLADMNGCMAHRRENVREGKIVKLFKQRVYNDYKDRWYVKIQLTTGDVVTRCADRHLWTLHDGRMEYRD